MQSECFESWKLLDIVAYTSLIFGHALLKNSSESLSQLFNDTVIIFIRQEATATIYDP